MPHMMPMMWLLIFMSSFLFLLMLCTLIYFFHIPTLPFKKPILKYYKWKWVW